MQTISNTPTCMLSHFYDWWIRKNVSMIDSCYHCLLVGEGGAASSVAGCQYCTSWCRSGRLVSGYSLPPPTLPTLSRILDHMALLRAAGDPFHWAGGRRQCPLICCLMRPVNSSCWTCSDARNIGRYDSIRYTQYRFQYDTDPIIVRSLKWTQMIIKKLRVNSLS